MSIPDEKKQCSMFDVTFIAEELFEKTNRFRLFREHVLPALRGIRSSLSELYCEENGRPAVEPVVMAGVSLLQFMEKMPDRQASEMVREHLGWKYALDLEIGYKGFHPTSLVKFRNRLLEGEQYRLVFDAVAAKLRKAGLTKKRSKQRLDSTHVLGMVSKMNRLQVVREAIRLVLKGIKKSKVQNTVPDCELLFERYCMNDIDWRHQTKKQLVERFKQSGEDALGILEWFKQDKMLQGSKEHQLLERVFNEQFEVYDDGVKIRANEDSGTVKNPHDADAQFASKDLAKTKTWVGYKAQISETVTSEPKRKGEPTEAFITEITTTEAIASDLDGMSRNLENQREHGQDPPPELFVDAAYITDDTLAEAKKKRRKLTGPARPPGNPTNLYSVEEFDVNLKKRKAVCPAGHVSTQCSLINDSYQKQKYYRFKWTWKCDSCELRKKCTASKTGRRILTVGIHYDLLQERRRKMKTEEYRKHMQKRNGVEGTISELSRLGLRRTRYRGMMKTTMANYFLGAACNVKRWLRLLTWNLEKEFLREYGLA